MVNLYMIRSFLSANRNSKFMQIQENWIIADPFANIYVNLFQKAKTVIVYKNEEIITRISSLFHYVQTQSSNHMTLLNS